MSSFAPSIAMICLVFLWIGWSQHEAKATCRYCGGYKGKHDDHCPWQGTDLWQ